MEDMRVAIQNGKYQYLDSPQGIDESVALDFHSPYGCSKGAADQYVHDYARIYGLQTVVFRQSCIYGTRQFGIEDQGWVAWFTIASVLGWPITIYGDGRQVRDILFIDDLVNCYVQAVEQVNKTSGNVYNIGGGPENQLSLLELLNMLEIKLDHPLKVIYADWRPSDQQVFVADIAKAERDSGWRPKISPAMGLDRLFESVCEEQNMLRSVLGDCL